MAEKVKVGIVGAGAAGLCALRHFVNYSTTPTQKAPATKFEAVCFEQSSRIGGTWLYSEKTGRDEFGLPVHSSMYLNLKTNLPKECMCFPDFPFPPNLSSYMGHSDVQSYLEQYAHSFGLLKHIQFQRKVSFIKPVTDTNRKYNIRWEITTINVNDFSVQTTDSFDAVVICNGHYSLPLIPQIEGADKFKGLVFHSHEYRRPDVFAGKKVVLLGANASGQDISLEIASTAKEVILSHNGPRIAAPLPPNLEQRAGIERFVGEKEVQFLDGSSESRVDAVLWCTGYHYDYSFLSRDCGIGVDDGRVTPLYKHLLHTKLPTLAIVGIAKRIVPFPMFDVQVRFFRAFLDGSMALPSEEEMEKETEADYRARLAAGALHRHAHDLASTKQFDYNDELADLARVDRIPPHVRDVYFASHQMKRRDLMNYKKTNFIVDEDNGGYKLEQ